MAAIKNDKSPMEELLGPTLLKSTTESAPTKKLLKDKQLVAFYFSASWCPPCRAFSPLLQQFYHHTRDKLEIVYISSDKTLADFTEYYGSMPWLAVGGDKEGVTVKSSLALKFKIQGIPALVVLDAKTGYFVTDQARAAVTSAAKDKDASLALIEQWKAVQAVPIEQALMGAGQDLSIQGVLKGIFWYILKHPAFIFAVLYFWRMAKRNWAGDGDDKESVPAVDESEF